MNHVARNSTLQYQHWNACRVPLTAQQPCPADGILHFQGNSSGHEKAGHEILGQSWRHHQNCKGGQAKGDCSHFQGQAALLGYPKAVDMGNFKEYSIEFGLWYLCSSFLRFWAGGVYCLGTSGILQYAPIQLPSWLFLFPSFFQKTK